MRLQRNMIQLEDEPGGNWANNHCWHELPSLQQMPSNGWASQAADETLGCQHERAAAAVWEAEGAYLIRLIRSKYFSKFNKPSISLIRLRQNRQKKNPRSLHFIFIYSFACSKFIFFSCLFKIKEHKKWQPRTEKTGTYWKDCNTTASQNGRGWKGSL